MSRIKWGRQQDKVVNMGLDRGVIYPPNGPAIPWNGLISVDESGSQETSTFYVDGRKFLSTVTPREYTAKISAYTFPDEFAELCGLVEATDGLFLDSQTPDQFGLSYRTRYGDGKHYKIHLIYGVTAAMSDLTYQTLSSDGPDPTTFEFDISAIPQNISGYRPTAHVIIDTRNLSPDMVVNLENQIYGTETTDAVLPTIQSLYEKMNYGSVVVIRDHGDGTWTAEGSYKYITIDEMTGEFVINAENITKTDHGDGSYTISDGIF